MTYLTWYSPSGVQIEFSSNSDTYRLLRSVEGFGTAPVSHITRQAPYQDGVTRVGTHFEPREISFDIMIMAPTRAAREWAERVLSVSLNPLQGTGTLVLTEDDGSAFALNCIGNNTPDFSGSDHSSTHRRATIDMIAHDPFLYEYPDQIKYFGAGTPVVFPYTIPWMFPSSTPQQVCTNSGNVPTGVTIVVSGEITNPSIARTYINSDGGSVTETISFTLAMTAGEVLTITTAPGNKQITLLHDDSTYDSNPYQYLNDKDFWQMVPGSNTVEVTSSAIAAETVTSVKWASRYSGV